MKNAQVNEYKDSEKSASYPSVKTYAEWLQDTLGQQVLYGVVPGTAGKLWISKTGRWLRSGMDNDLSTFYRTLGLKTKPSKIHERYILKGASGD